MVALVKDADPRIRQVAMLSLMKVFNDILPVGLFPAVQAELPDPPGLQTGEGGSRQQGRPKNPAIRGVADDLLPGAKIPPIFPRATSRR